jgi:hypothetical protein
MSTHPWLRLAALLTAALFASFAIQQLAWAGPLNPPAAPAPTDGVRTPGIPISTLPITISQAGYYYVTRPLSLASGDGITITTSNVTIDLGGFTLIGNAGGTGIISNGPRNITVRNGAVRSWNTGVGLAVTYGRIERVQASSNVTGIAAGGLVVIEDCTVALNTFGIAGLSQIIVRRSNIAENSDYGVSLSNRSLIESSQISLNGTGVVVNGVLNVLRDNQLNSNSLDAFLATSSNATTLIENVYCLVQSQGGAVYGTLTNTGGVCL